MASRGALAWLLLDAGIATAQVWDPFPSSTPTNDFGGVGLMQTPTARFAPDGQISFGANHVQPYDRYYFTVQAMPWVEATLRLTTVRNVLYSSVPEFSGNQSYKDRGFDLKLKLLEEDGWRPAVAFGLRDFVGTGLFSSEYFVANKSFGAIDLSLGVGWGNLASRGGLPNPFRALSDRFRDRGEYTMGGGTVNGSYFKGKHVAVFGGAKYDTPIKGLTLLAEYDSNDYKSEALSNRFKAPLPINLGVSYSPRSWIEVRTSFERGNRVGLNLTLTTNFNKPFRIPKFDPPPPPLDSLDSAKAASTVETTADAKPSALIQKVETSSTETAPTLSVNNADVSAVPVEVRELLRNALAIQGSGLYAAEFAEREATLYVAQSRFRSMPTGLSRIARAAFSALPERFAAISVVFVEGGVETIAVRVYRDALRKALTPTEGSPEELLSTTDFRPAPLALADADYKTKLETGPPRFFYSVRPFLRTTLGRPEQFILYQTGVKLNGYLQVRRGLSVQGSIGVNVSDNFDKLREGSDSKLPHVRSDIKDYLREGKTFLQKLHADYSFNIAPSLYGHVYAGLLEEMFGGFGGEVLYRNPTTNWAVGADLSFVKQRAYNQRFGFRDYKTITGFVTGAYYFPRADIDFRLRVGRYLAKDYGATLDVSRTFDSGVVVGAFATKTNVSAATFGEGRFDKGIYMSIPLDAIYIRNVRGSVGLNYRPLTRDGGQMLQMPNSLLTTTDETIEAKFRRDWSGIDD